jgi:hypothetical protein
LLRDLSIGEIGTRFSKLWSVSARFLENFSPAANSVVYYPHANSPLPAHHDPSGGFRNPWPTANLPGFREVLRWRREAARMELPRDPDPADIPTARPDPALPHARPGELRATWLGHSSFLLQIGGLNLLVDPQLSERASPVPFAGPKRFLPAALSVDALPPIDGVLLSHDHYDHLDDPTVPRSARSTSASASGSTGSSRSATAGGSAGAGSAG